MSNGTAHEIALYVATQGLGVFGGSAGWVVGANGEPPSPDTAITIYDTGGQDLDTDEQDVAQPSFQVRVRSKSQIDARQKQLDIRAILVRPGEDPAFDGVTLRFTAVQLTTDILFIGRDGNDRFLFTANFRARCTEKET